jgi:hypothetical protein
MSSRSRFPLPLVLVAALAGGLALGCTLPASGRSTPSVSITSPTNGEVVSGSGVTVRWTAVGMEVKPAAEATRKEQAHFHVFVDRAPVLNATEPWGTEAIHTGVYQQRVEQLAPGTHTVWVAAGSMDHSPYSPYAVDSVTFVVR